jgi:signal transduction histidine kinase/CheY-like chemotaxis protein
MQPSAKRPTIASLQSEIAELRARLEEAEETLRAIREGEVDAVIVSGSQGDRVFSLMETENLHRLMVETMNEAGFALSPDGLLLYCNDRAATLLRRARGALLGRRLDEFVAPQDAGRLRALLDASPRGTADDRVVFCADDGTALPLHLWASRLDRPEAPMICLVGTDLTRLEAERALVEQLEEQQRALSASRAEALDSMAQALAARAKAAQSAQELRETDRRKDDFLATLAHELRNPLAPIRNALETLRLSDGGGPDAIEALAIAERQFAHLVRLLDDLLDLSRITRDKIDLRPEPVELSAIIESAVETVRPLVDTARQRLTVSLPPGPLWLEADAMRLAQVFGNLLNNATKYTGAGGEIRLEVEQQDRDVMVSVRDTGIGIPAALLPHVFELFRQGDPDQVQGHGGLGIGLSLAKRLTELHGGRVEVHSEGPGRGSKLCVLLPLMAEQPARPARHGNIVFHALSDLPPACRILVVDDNRDAASSLASLLERKGGEVRIAFDGPSALEILAEQRPDLVILDIGMPGMDGHEVARRIRAHPEFSRTSLIAMSGLGQKSDRQRSLEAGFDHHLVKPVPFDVLDSLLTTQWGPGPKVPAQRDTGAIPAQPQPDPTVSGRPAQAPRSPADNETPPGTAAPPERRTEVIDLIAASLIHDLAQPLNTAGCYALAARNLASKLDRDVEHLGMALRGIEQQIQLAGTVMDRLRELFHGVRTTRSNSPEDASSHIQDI